jgi:hypothetical protein
MSIPQSEAHYHTADMPCLELAPEVPTGDWTQVDGKSVRVTVNAPGWWRCTKLVDYYVHEHGIGFYAHHPRETCAFAA